jgi:hypothetical protein
LEVKSLGVAQGDLVEARKAVSSMISRTETSKVKFKQGTSQHTLQKNRLKALTIALDLINAELGQGDVTSYTQDDLQRAVAPIESLISKSEKAQKKVSPGTWQHAMLDSNLKALHLVLPLLEERLRHGQM